MHIQFWWAFSVLALGPDLLSRSSRSRCSLEQQRMNGFRILSNCRSLMGFTSTSPIAASAPRIDLAPGLFSAAGEVYAPGRLGEVSVKLAEPVSDASAICKAWHPEDLGDCGVPFQSTAAARARTSWVLVSPGLLCARTLDTRRDDAPVRRA